MNTLSVISIIIYTSFLIGAIRMYTSGMKSVLNKTAAAVLLSLGWWSFCNSFFYAATTVEQAWVWHKLSSIGWCGFVPITAYYFLALVNFGNQRYSTWKKVLFFTPSILLIGKNLFGTTTSLAQDIVQSTSGWGWTYQNSITSIWLWLYLLQVIFYFGFTFYLLYRWKKTVTHKLKKAMAIEFIILDSLTILFGVVTDVIFPLTRPLIPALANIGTAFFGIGYFSIIYRHDVFNINLVISAEDILKTCDNPIFVLDENKEILKYNVAAGNLLGYNKTELIGVNFMDMTLNSIDLAQTTSFDRIVQAEAQMCCKDDTVKTVWISVSIAEDRKHNFLCMIASCQDVTKQIKIQKELTYEQEKYKKLAADYQKLANYDSLTDLPNRRYFFDALSHFEELYETEQKDFAVLFLDVDNFKHINDVYGHKVGDELLIATADKLKACVEINEFVARLGGDEFMVIMPCKTMADIEQKLQRIRDEFSKAISLNGLSYQIKLSIGCSMFSKIGDGIKLMQIADEEMYRHKQRKSTENL
ncbi:MAG: diguanylate cyclase [Clostridia bacterium]